MFCKDNSNINTSTNFYNNFIGELYLFGCYFFRINSYNNKGGCIFNELSDCSLNLNECSFYNCSSTSYGGAIYFFSLCSNLNKICFFHCFAITSGFHSYFIRTNSNQNNSLIFVTISKCSPFYNNGYTSCYLRSGNQLLKNFNSSNNLCFESSSFENYGPDSFNGIHCTFYNNTATQICIYFQTGSNERIINYSNFIKNQSPNLKLFLLIGTSYNLNNFIFYENLGLIAGISISNSFIDHNNLGSFESINNSFFKIPSFDLPYYSIIHCLFQKNGSNQRYFNSKIFISLIIFYF